MFEPDLFFYLFFLSFAFKHNISYPSVWLVKSLPCISPLLFVCVTMNEITLANTYHFSLVALGQSLPFPSLPVRTWEVCPIFERFGDSVASFIGQGCHNKHWGIASCILDNLKRQALPSKFVKLNSCKKYCSQKHYLARVSQIPYTKISLLPNGPFFSSGSVSTM